MPTYEYLCEACGRKTADFRPFEDRAKPQSCACGGRAEYVVSVPSVHLDGVGGFRGASRTRAELRALERQGCVCLGGLAPHKVSDATQKMRDEVTRDAARRFAGDLARKARDPVWMDRAVSAIRQGKEVPD